MANFSRDELLTQSNGSIYKLVVLATKRALEIAEGAPNLVGADTNTKANTIALEEIAQHKIKVKKDKKSKGND